MTGYHMAVYHMAAFVVGFFLDLWLGDPLCGFHIVVWMGKAVSLLERWIRKIFPRKARWELAGGAILVLILCAGSFGAIRGALYLLYRYFPPAGFLAESFLCWQCLAMKCLKKESLRVYACRNELPSAQAAVGRIVGRDTDRLDMAGVFRACVETVAENSSDGVIAPMLYLALGGAPLGVLYKAINTMDSMLGYKNERYLFFGRAAAKLDDAVNFVPARLAALLALFSAWLLKLDGANAWRIFLRDRRCHASPNSAQTESVYAGALHIRLGGPASYFDREVDKPYLGDDDRPIEAEDILRADRLLYVSGFLCFFLCLCLKGLCLKGMVML